MSDIFREVEEDLRHERLRRLWDRLGPYIIAIAILIVLVTGGYRGWQTWTKSQAEQAGDAYMQALQSADAGRTEEAEAKLQEIAKGGASGYAALARLRSAGLKEEAGDTEGALAAFDALAADKGVSEALRDVASLRAGYLIADGGSRADIEKRVSGLTGDENPWRHSARELMALAAFGADDFAAARKWYETIVSDPATPSQIVARARMMLEVITSRIGPVEDAPAADAKKDEGQ